MRLSVEGEGGVAPAAVAAVGDEMRSLVRRVFEMRSIGVEEAVQFS